MEHSKMFEMLENHYESIELYEQGQRDIRIKSFGYDDKFIEHGTVEEIEKKYGLTAEEIIKEI